MKTIDDINLHTWFVSRELDFTPEHFIPSSTPLTADSKAWILEKLIGRFATTHPSSMFGGVSSPAFEDPKEAVFYELTWG